MFSAWCGGGNGGEQTGVRGSISQLKQQMHQKDAEIVDLSEQKMSISQRLSDTRNKLLVKGEELVDCKETWEVKCREQNDKFCKILDEKNQFYMTKIKQMQDNNETLQHNLNEDLEYNSKSWESIVQQMDDEKTLLEKICLDLKRKKRGLFHHRHPEDPKTSLQKMKSKMLKKKMKETEEEQEVEVEEQKEPEKEKKGFFHRMFRKKKSDCDSRVEEEAACCSTQDGQQ